MLLNVSLPPPPPTPRVLAYSDFYSAVFSFGYIIIIFKYRSVRGPDLDIMGGGGKGAVSKVWSEYRGEGRGPSLGSASAVGFRLDRFWIIFLLSL